AVQPGVQPAVAVEGFHFAEGADERFLHGVGGVLLAVHELSRGGKHATSEVAHEGFESALVAVAKAFDEFGFIACDERLRRRVGRDWGASCDGCVHGCTVWRSSLTNCEQEMMRRPRRMR